MKTPTWETSAGALLTFVNAATSMLMADLYTFTLVNGDIIRYTDCEIALTVDGKLFSAGPKLQRSTIKQAVGVQVDTLTVDVYAEDDVLFGTTPLIQAFSQGQLDNARVVVERLYASDPDTPIGTLMRFSGRIGNVVSQRGHAQLEVRSDLDVLDIMIPSAVYQPSCRNTLYDLNCGVVRATYAQSKTVNAGSNATRLTFAVASGNLTADYLSLGVATCTSGDNNGVSRTIKRHTVSGANSIIEVIQPWPNAVDVGDVFTLAPGCDKLAATCNAKFNNLIHFAAEPYVPVPDTIV